MSVPSAARDLLEAGFRFLQDAGQRGAGLGRFFQAGQGCGHLRGLQVPAGVRSWPCH